MTAPKEMEIYEVPTCKKEFRIMLLEKFTELQKNTEKTLKLLKMHWPIEIKQKKFKKERAMQDLN